MIIHRPRSPKLKTEEVLDDVIVAAQNIFSRRCAVNLHTRILHRASNIHYLKSSIKTLVQQITSRNSKTHTINTGDSFFCMFVQAFKTGINNRSTFTSRRLITLLKNPK